MKQIPLSIQGHTIHLFAFLLPVTGADIILSASWLATLGPHVADYSTLTIKFFDGSVFFTLRGDSPNLPSASQAHYHHLRLLHHTNAISALFTLHSLLSIDAEDPLVDLLPPPPSDMLTLLRKYISVFHKPYGLPPSRSHDHAIPLLLGVSLVKVHPYRYPFSYKIEIEKIVFDLLQEGLIQHSISPFSSPLGHRFIIRTDHKSLRSLMDQTL